MIVKPRAVPADPTKVCRTCSHYDPNLHVCCANDYAIHDEEANTMSCSDWNPKKICITCDHFDPDTNQCCSEEYDMSEEDSMTRTCESWEQREDKQTVFGDTSLNELEAKAKVWGHQQEAKTLNRGAKQGMTLEALDTVFAIACQQVPSMEQRWMELKAEINVMFAQKWSAEDMTK